MFYLFLLTGIIVNTLFTLSLTESLVSWIVLLLGYLASEYMHILRTVALSRSNFDESYAHKMEEIREQLMSAQVQKAKQAAEQAAKSATRK